MLFDVIAEVVIKGIVEVIGVGIFYWPGWLTLRTLTFGRYPPKRGTPHSKEFVGACGFIAIVVSLLVMMHGGGL